MKRGKGDGLHWSWRRFAHVLLGAVLLCLVSISFELSKLLKPSFSGKDASESSVASVDRGSDLREEASAANRSGSRWGAADEKKAGEFVTSRIAEGGSNRIAEGGLRTHLEEAANSRVAENHSTNAPHRPQMQPLVSRQRWQHTSSTEKPWGYSRITNRIREANANSGELPSLQTLSEISWAAGAKRWRNIQNGSITMNTNHAASSEVKSCPSSLSKSNEEMEANKNALLLPCGLMLGSAITVVGKPRPGRWIYMPRGRKAKGAIFVSQFFLELQGLIAADGEDPPRILHVNPRLKGDWSESPVIELNTCYRGQWGSAQRCDGWDSPKDEDTVDRLPKCESWIIDVVKGEKESKNKRWLDMLVGNTKKMATEWRYPFLAGQMFILTVRAGWEGYHISVDGRHVASFPYRTGFILEEATGLSIKGDIDLDSVVVTALPLTHLNFSSEKILELSEKLKGPPVPLEPIELFIGILSASNHFAERMAARKSWMRSSLITSSKVVARFFVALHESNEVNAQVIKEATFYGDVVIVPFMDQYELLVLKTIAICEYGVQNMSAKYIMKCDDDTFVRVETLLHEVKETHCDHGLYMGNINLYHKPLRLGKWAVTYEEWPEEDYPPYANGPGYVITSDIADFIVSQHTNHSLRLFKMEDVSMGMWVVQFNLSHSVKYQHNWKFCQFGCVENYLTAHYQSPRQMLCLWEKLSHGKPECCNTRR